MEAGEETLGIAGVGDVATGGTGIGGAVPFVGIRSNLSGGDTGSSPSQSPRSNPPGLDLKDYNIDTEKIEDLARDPKKEKVKKLAKNCSQGNKELCGWIMHKFGKIKDPNDKEYEIILGYELNETTKAKKSNKPIFGIIVRQTESKTLKEIPVPKSCGDCVVPTVWRNNGEEKCKTIPNEKIKPNHFCVKPCKEYLFQIFILNYYKHLPKNNNNIIFNGYENAQNYELLNRIGQIMKPKLFWAKILNTEKNNEFFKFNELSLNLSKININFPVFSDFLDLNKGSQEKVRNLLMTPEIIEFYVENPGLVTREVKQLLIALSDCYDVAKRYTGIFCEIKLDDGKISGYGVGGSDITDNACKKLLKEKKMGRFNEELVVDNGCGGGGGGVNRQRVLYNPAYDNVESKEYKEFIEAKIAQGKILDWDIEIKRLEKYKTDNSTDKTAIQQCDATIKILEKQKNIYKQKLDEKSKKYIADRSGKNKDKKLENTENPLFFLQNQNNSCWIDSIIYFLYAIDNFNDSYFFKPLYIAYFTNIGDFINNSKNKNSYGSLDWDQNFLRSLLTSEYQSRGFNDVAEVANVIFDQLLFIREIQTTSEETRYFINSQYLLSDGNSNNLDQNSFFLTLFPNYLFTDFPRNLILQNPTNHQSQYKAIVTGNLEYLRSVLIDNIIVPNNVFSTTTTATYKLVSFIVNTGDGVHFICYFLKNSQWWKYNDSKTDLKFEKKNNLKRIQTEIASEPNSKIVLYNYIYESETNIL